MAWGMYVTQTDDNDGVCDQGKSDPSCVGSDNCRFVYNPDQVDIYPPGGNGCGDACDCIGNINRDENVNILDVSMFMQITPPDYCC